jgi:cyclopropane fatty-acyl-phospholipid synthase-like methyltransferase
MKSIGEIFQLGKVFFQVLKWDFKEEKKVKELFYKNHTFAQIDTLLKKIQVVFSVFYFQKISQEKGDSDIHKHGETPITTIDAIAKRVGLTKNDHLFELGSGRCRAAFFLAAEYGCKASAIDMVPDFCLKQLRISLSDLKEINTTFTLGDITSMNLSSATVIYLYGTCLEDDRN